MLIDIFHDTACPWCRIGKKHLFDAITLMGYKPTDFLHAQSSAPLTPQFWGELEDMKSPNVGGFRGLSDSDAKGVIDINWHPFLLDDSIPPQGVEFRSFMKTRKGIGAQQLSQLFDYASASGAKAGVKLDFDNISLAVNTTLSHRLIAITPKDHKNIIVEAIYKAYFEDGLNIGDIDTLARLGKDFGFDESKLKQQLSSDAAKEEVITDAKAARNRGISSVPFFVINNKVSISGSQSVEVFIQAMQPEFSASL